MDQTQDATVCLFFQIKYQAYKSSHCSDSVIPFIDLGSSGGTLTGVDDGSTPAITLPSPLLIGDNTVTTAYVS